MQTRLRPSQGGKFAAPIGQPTWRTPRDLVALITEKATPEQRTATEGMTIEAAALIVLGTDVSAEMRAWRAANPSVWG